MQNLSKPLNKEATMEEFAKGILDRVVLMLAGVGAYFILTTGGILPSVVFG